MGGAAMLEPRRIEILGGGLAGLALGLGLQRRGLPVVLREAGHYPRHRVCGEFLTALDPATREDLHLDEVLAPARPAHHIVWLEPGCAPLRHVLPEPALILSRHHLDQALAAAFQEAGGELHTGQRVTPEPRPGRVLACGRRPDTNSPWLGLKQHFDGLEMQGDLEVQLGRGAYVGLTRVETGAVNVCGLFPRGTSSSQLSDHCRAAGLTELAARLSSARPVPGSQCAVAGLNYHTPSAPDRHAVVLGDHHGLIPPFTGHGMTIALQTAAAALAPLADWVQRPSVDWPETTARIRREVSRRCGARLNRARRLHPWMLSPGRRRSLHLLHRWGLLPLAPLYRLLH